MHKWKTISLYSGLSIPFIFFAKKYTFFAKLVNKMDLILYIFTIYDLLTNLTLEQKNGQCFKYRS